MQSSYYEEGKEEIQAPHLSWASTGFAKYSLSYIETMGAQTQMTCLLTVFSTLFNLC